MKALMSLLVLGLAVCGMAAENREAYITPCSSWQYDFDAHAHVCRFVDSRIRVYESRDVDQLIRTLQTKIDQLEARVQKLESGGR